MASSLISKMDSVQPQTYNYPHLKLGVVCEVPGALKLEESNTVHEHIWKLWHDEPDQFMQEVIAAVSLGVSSHLWSSEAQEYVMKTPRKGVFEGPVVNSPRVAIDIKEGDSTFNVILTSSIAVCVPPNDSKIWVSGLLRRYNGQDASAVPMETVVRFFGAIEVVCKSLAKQLLSLYSKSINGLLDRGSKTRVRDKHEFIIKTLGGNSEAIHSLMEPIRRSEPFRISDAFKNSSTHPIVRDIVQLSFGRTINSADEYLNLTETFRNSWKRRKKGPSEVYLGDVQEKGYQWFGLSAGGRDKRKVAVFSRVETLNGPTNFVGIAEDLLEHDRSTDTRDEPDCASRAVSTALVQDIAPYI